MGSNRQLVIDGTHIRRETWRTEPDSNPQDRVRFSAVKVCSSSCSTRRRAGSRIIDGQPPNPCREDLWYEVGLPAMIVQIDPAEQRAAFAFVNSANHQITPQSHLVKRGLRQKRPWASETLKPAVRWRVLDLRMVERFHRAIKRPGQNLLYRLDQGYRKARISQGVNAVP